MSRFTKEHYEDVAGVLHSRTGRPDIAHLYRDGYREAVQTLAKDFADLFAADNPNILQCSYCDATRDDRLPCPERGVSGVETRPPHSFLYHKGFDSEKFLEACGLKREPDVLTELKEKADQWEEGYPRGED